MSVWIFKNALNENIIAILDTGAERHWFLPCLLNICKLLKIKNIKLLQPTRYKKKRFNWQQFISLNYIAKNYIFLVERVLLAFQQTNVLESNCDVRIEKLCGEMNVDVWSLEKWRSILDNVDVCVMTAQIFLDILQRAFLSLDQVIIRKICINQQQFIR